MRAASERAAFANGTEIGARSIIRAGALPTRIILFGGQKQEVPMGDTWELLP